MIHVPRVDTTSPYQTMSNIPVGCHHLTQNIVAITYINLPGF